MEKILVNLFVPSVQKNFDLFIPQDVEIGKLTEALKSGVAYMCPARFMPSGNEVMLVRNLSQPLDPGRQLCEYGVRNGTQLILL